MDIEFVINKMIEKLDMAEISLALTAFDEVDKQ